MEGYEVEQHWKQESIMVDAQNLVLLKEWTNLESSDRPQLSEPSVW